MKTMLEELKRLNPELHYAYEQSEKIATEEWLPVVQPRKGSFNSLPHINGVRRQIDQILFNNDPNQRVEIELNATELYVLLCSILLHDIGRSVNEDKHQGNEKHKKDAKEDHAKLSEEHVSQRWAELKIVSKKMAKIISWICRGHDCTDKAAMERLEDVSHIERYGSIRSKALCTLLILGDHLDNSYTRAISKSLRSANDSSGDENLVGDFRSKIQCVRVDKQSQAAYTVIDKQDIEERDLDGEKIISGPFVEFLNKKTPQYNNNKSMIHMIVRNLISQQEMLDKIQDDLSVIGLPIKKFYIECNNRLFGFEGKENDAELKTKYVLEPALDIDYCTDVLEAMIFLTYRVFTDRHEYSEILNHINGDQNTLYKIKMAVKRISIIMNDSENQYKFYYDANRWGVFLMPKADGKVGLYIPKEKDKWVYLDDEIKKYIQIFKDKVGESNG